MKRQSLVLVLCFMFFACNLLSAQKLKIAVAANLQGVMQLLKADFKKSTNIDVEIITGSSGKLVAQITNGAPFDVFLSADMDFPQALYKKGLTQNKPVIYAFGKLVVCSSQPLNLNSWPTLLKQPGILKIAVANPKTAPYGKAAIEALKNQGIYPAIVHKIVFGESISQVNTYITTGVVSIGFTTEALVKDRNLKTKLYWKEVDSDIYQSIKQGMVILKNSASKGDAQKFYQYILSPAAKRIFKQYGYKTL